MNLTKILEIALDIIILFGLFCALSGGFVELLNRGATCGNLLFSRLFEFINFLNDFRSYLFGYYRLRLFLNGGLAATFAFIFLAHSATVIYSLTKSRRSA